MIFCTGVVALKRCEEQIRSADGRLTNTAAGGCGTGTGCSREREIWSPVLRPRLQRAGLQHRDWRRGVAGDWRGCAGRAATR